MLNGKLSTPNSNKLFHQVPKSFSHHYPSEIWPLNISPIEIFSVLEEFKRKTWEELKKPLEEEPNQPLQILKQKCSEHVEISKKNKLVLRDSIFSLNVLNHKQPLLSSEEGLNNSLKRPKEVSMMPLWLSEEWWRLKKLFLEEEPLKWNWVNYLDKRQDKLKERNILSCRVMPRLWKLFLDAWLKMEGFKWMKFWINWEKFTLKMKMDNISELMYSMKMTLFVTLMKTSYGNLNWWRRTISTLLMKLLVWF